jgi:hypothetical protein
MTLMTMPLALDRFAAVMVDAEKLRRVLHNQYGLSDHQIATMAMGRQKGMSQLENLGQSFLRAKQSLAKRKST